MYDETPDQAYNPSLMTTTTASNAIYSDHIGKIGNKVEAKEQVDTSQYRHRGYKMGSLMIGPDDKETYYKQPGKLKNNVKKGTIAKS